MKKIAKKIRLAAVLVNEKTARKLKDIGDKEKRTIANQAAYILETWGDNPL